MLPTVQARADLVAAMQVLARRRLATADLAEQATLDAAVDALAALLPRLNQAQALDAATAVAQASDLLEGAVAAARQGPFGTHLADLQAALGRIDAQLAALQASERLPPAPDAPPRSTRGGPQVVAAPVAAAAGAAGGGGPAPINSRRFEDLEAEYADFFARCTVRPGMAGNVEFYVTRLLRGKSVYAQTGAPLGVPWVFVGVVHGMECGFNFQTHLHNGDPLSARTVQVPRGRPATGQPPFSWSDSARDALLLRKLNEVGRWDMPRLLFQLEGYNGFGYRPRGVPTPYLWSFSNLYTSGKYVGDGSFDPQAVSKQCGAALMIKALQQRGAL